VVIELAETGKQSFADMIAISGSCLLVVTYIREKVGGLFAAIQIAHLNLPRHRVEENAQKSRRKFILEESAHVREHAEADEKEENRA
jgi:hypothetical protein